MIIDTDAKTVEFTKPQTLTLAQLRSLIELLDNDFEYDVEDDADVLMHFYPAEFGRYYIGITKIYQVLSNAGTVVYSVVEFEDGTWACSCPDWIHRKSLVGSYCKHIHLTRDGNIWL